MKGVTAYGLQLGNQGFQLKHSTCQFWPLTGRSMWAACGLLLLLRMCRAVTSRPGLRVHSVFPWRFLGRVRRSRTFLSLALPWSGQPFLCSRSPLRPSPAFPESQRPTSLPFRVWPMADNGLASDSPALQRQRTDQGAQPKPKVGTKQQDLRDLCKSAVLLKAF